MKFDIELYKELLICILPALITGIFTFLITKYGYYKNIPLDKMEISYDKIYYPIYRLIKKGEDRNIIIKKCEFYFDKYNKYVDKSTIKAFNYLKDDREEKDDAYINFNNNIFKICGNLRRRLGYLESNIFNMYIYSAPEEKQLVRIFLYGAVIYIMFGINLIIKIEIIQNISTILILGLSFALVIEIFAWIIFKVMKGCRKLIEKLKSVNK